MGEGNFTETEKTALFRSLGSIEAHQENTKIDIAEIKKEQKSQREVITGIRVKSARDAGAISGAVGVVVFITAKWHHIKSFFLGGGQ